MKIGAVCEQTGLSDRTVRFYTEEGLLSPSYTKNYLGRKTFDFSEGDVAMLKSIAVLRKYGFSIPEIKSILEDPEKSVEIIAAVRQKKQDTIHSEQELLDVLLTLEAGKAYTVPELAEALNTPKLASRKLPEENDGCLYSLCVILFWLICAPTALLMIITIPFSIWDYSEVFVHVKYYPWFATWVLEMLGVLAPVLAAGIMLWLRSRRGRMNPGVRQTACIVLFFVYAVFGNLAVINAVFASPFPGIYSETEDPANYMILGTYERDEMGNDLDVLFPDQIPGYALGENGMPCPETTRYYNYVDCQWDWRFELFAQWQLTEQDLAAEKNRIREELGDAITSEGQLGQWEYWSMRMDPAPCMENHTYYEKRFANYAYLFFAYNEGTGMVRYISCASDDQTIVPAFCALDWN